MATTSDLFGRSFCGLSKAQEPSSRFHDDNGVK